MTKLVGNAGKLVEYIRKNIDHVVSKNWQVDIKAVKEKARDYFFLAKNKAIEIKCEVLTERQLAKLPWHIRRAFDQIKSDA